MKKFIAILCILIVLGTSVYFYVNRGEVSQIGEKNENVVGNIPETLYSQKEDWEDENLMSIGNVSGIYKTGYAFIDIDLDGEKEFAVQLGGGTLHNCRTNFYKYENGELVLKNFFDEIYSISVNDLRKFTSPEGENFYINKYRLKYEPTKYATRYDKIISGAYGLEAHTIFKIDEEYNEKEEAEYTYWVKGEKVSSNEYYDELEKYFDSLTEDILVNNFIYYEDWEKLSADEQMVLLKKTYSNEDYEYALEIQNEVILKKDTKENVKTFDIILNEEIFGEELKEYKESLKVNEISAKLITDEETFVQIIPAPEFLNNQTFYFRDGKKVAYVKEFVGIGGQVEYYLKNGELVYINKAGIEENMIFEKEDETNILTRANNVYSKYIK